jgi:hypothetical protein
MALEIPYLGDNVVRPDYANNLDCEKEEED